MLQEEFNRDRLSIKKLSERRSALSIPEALVPGSYEPRNLRAQDRKLIKTTAERIIRARESGSSVMLAFGAHTIKNGLAPFLINMISGGWITHLATNGAGLIHDWEFAYSGKTGEDVRENVKNGEFGLWEETGTFINLALAIGAYYGRGYGESIGRMISEEELLIPDAQILSHDALTRAHIDPSAAAAAIDLRGLILKNRLKEGYLKIPHPFKTYSVAASAYDLKVTLTCHPMFGHDIIYTHPLNCGAAIGRTAQTDFLRYAGSVSRLEKGVYISLGSAIMSPMVFEKSLSMAQNIKIQRKKHIDHHFILVVDLARSDWDWIRDGEPPADNPSYYLRYCKTFSRMGGTMKYLSADNRDFIVELHNTLSTLDKS